MVALSLTVSVRPAAARVNVNMYASSGPAGNQVPQDPATLVGPIGGSGETWNQFNTTSGSSLLNATGGVTSVGFNNNVGSGWLRTGATLTMLLAERALFGKGADTTHTITGLTPGTRYDIWIASCVHNAYDPEAGHGEWSTPNPTVTWGLQAINNFNLNGSTWEYGNNFVCFEQVEADGSGEIVLHGDATDAGEIDSGLAYRLGLSGWQIRESSESVVGPVDPDVSQVQADPTLVKADGASTSVVTVILKDALGLAVTNKNVILLNTAGPQTATIIPATSQATDASGVATFTVRSASPGTETFTASNVTDSIVITQTADVDFVGSVDPAVSTVEAWPTNVYTDGSATITVRLKSSSGFPIPGKDVALLNTAGPQLAVIDPVAAQTTDASGVATFAVSSTNTGVEVFTATNVTDNMLITQTASVEFQELPPPEGGLISVNLYAYGNGLPNEWGQESWKETVRIDAFDPDRSAGVWETIYWQNVVATDASETITSDDGVSTATYARLSFRNASPYWWVDTRDDSDSVDTGTATLLDGHGCGTEVDPGGGNPFPNVIYDFEVRDIPYEAYDVIVYFGINDGQYYSGQGNIRINELIHPDPTDQAGRVNFQIQASRGEPTGALDPVDFDGDIGNYILFEKLTAATFRAQVWGDGFTHLGPAGFQIKEAVPLQGGTVLTIR